MFVLQCNSETAFFHMFRSSARWFSNCFCNNSKNHVSNKSLFHFDSMAKSQESCSEQVQDGSNCDGEGPLPADSLVAEEVRELREVAKILQTELTRHFSLKADVRDFENIDVTVNGKHYKMNHLGRITMRGGDTLMINFSENPASIKEAKAALEKSMLGVNPQQEGVALHVPLPKVTRELREHAVRNSKKIFNDYKTELNKIFAKHDKLNTNSGADLDTVHNRSKIMLEYKRQFDDSGKELLEEKQKAVMQEVK